MNKYAKSVVNAVLLAIVFALGARGDEGSALTTAFRDLAKDDQVEFVRAVNTSMANYKASSPQRRQQTIYVFNRDAVRSSSAKEKKAVIAEVFATAPKDALPRIVEGFAEELFSRKAAGFSEKDDSFFEFASATLMRVRTRLAQLPVEEFPGARSALAVICFLRASGGQPADLRDSFLFYVLTGSQEIARKEWIPAALGDDGKSPSLQAVLTAGIRGEEPGHVNLHAIASSQRMLQQKGEQLIEGAKDVSGIRGFEQSQGVGGANGGSDIGVTRVPRAAVQNKSSPWYSRRRGDAPAAEEEGYMGQGL